MKESRIRSKIRQLKELGMSQDEIKKFAHFKIDLREAPNVYRFWLNVHNNVGIHYNEV